MKMRDMLAEGEPTLSFEMFPLETEDAYDSVEKAATEIAKLKPSFMSIIYGVGGGTNEYTAGVTSTVKEEYGTTPLTYLICVSSIRKKVHHVLGKLRGRSTENTPTLRGDIPRDGNILKEYYYASELTRGIKKVGDFYIGAACYPEGHVESANKSVDVDHLKQKVKAGCGFVTTRMFLDNSILHSYLYRIREKEIQVPVITGIIPVVNAKRTRRIARTSGTYLPSRFMFIVDRFGDNPMVVKQAGIAYATGQIIDLITNGTSSIHVYPVDKSDVAMKIRENLPEILQG